MDSTHVDEARLSRVYILVVDHGYDNYEDFPALGQDWTAIEAVLRHLCAHDDGRLQTGCEALVEFPEFSGRCRFAADTYEAAERRAEDVDAAGWRA